MRRFVSVLLPLAAWSLAAAPAPSEPPLVRPMAQDAGEALKALVLPAGWTAELWAAEPLLAGPVAISFDERGRLYVAEHHRNRRGVEDTRDHRYWRNDDLAAVTTADRLAYMEKWAAAGKRPMTHYTALPERLVRLDDTNGDGRADASHVIAAFQGPLDGVNAGVFARQGNVWVTCIPHLWRFRDDGNAPPHGEPLLSGFGAKFTFHGHDMHGVVMGPDGRLYWSIGDRGYHVVTREGKTLADAWRGAVFRAEPDGSNMEVFCVGVRNPQELVFDELGNLITVDNDNDAEDQPRILQLLPGGDYGWRGSYLWHDETLAAAAPKFGRPWYVDGLWREHHEAQPAWVLPAIAHLSNGPCGLVREPGASLLAELYRGSFLLADFRGGRTNSPVIAFQLRAKGTSFELVAQEDLIGGALPVDVTFAPDGRLFVADHVGTPTVASGGRRTGQGWIFAVSPPVSAVVRAAADEVGTWLREGFAHLPIRVLCERLAHADYRVRLEAQFALVDRGAAAVDALVAVAHDSSRLLATVHALQALGQLQRRRIAGLERVLPLLDASHAEIRAQTARQLSDTPLAAAEPQLEARLQDPAPRVRLFAALALGRLGNARSISAIAGFLHRNEEADPQLRHAGVEALVRIAETGGRDLVAPLTKHPSAAVRLGALLVHRRLGLTNISVFLRDSDPRLVAEAARAINDEMIDGATAALADLDENLPSLHTEVGRRVLNAHYRLGAAENAAALARVAARPDVPEVLRQEALAMLAQFNTPAPTERITGKWAPLRPRDPAFAASAVATLPVQAMLAAPAEVAGAFVALAADYPNMQGVTAGLIAMADDSARPEVQRAAAARALRLAGGRSTGGLEHRLVASADPTLRAAGRDLLLSVDASRGMDELERGWRDGTPEEQRAALAAWASRESVAAFKRLTQSYDDLIENRVPLALALDVDAAMDRGARHPRLLYAERPRRLDALAERRRRWRDTFPAADSLADHRMALDGGDPQNGRKLFREKVEFSCMQCHRSEGVGTSDVGPDLTGVGARRDREYLLRAIVQPGADFAAGFEFGTLTLQDGSTLSGVVHRETDSELHLRTGAPADAHAANVVVQKSGVRSRTAASAMPPLAALMGMDELRDLVAYLAELR